MSSFPPQLDLGACADYLLITEFELLPGREFRMNSNAIREEKCTACRRDAPLVTDLEVQELKPQIPDWVQVERGGVQQLERVFTVKDFVAALRFTNRVGALAEEQGHHPAILTEWGRVTVTLWTHKIRGLHRNDFIMAAKIDALAAEPGS